MEQFPLERVRFSDLSGLEEDVVDEALRRISKEGLPIHVTTNPEAYRRDLQRKDGVYLLCDPHGNLQDIEPLLKFVPPEVAARYQQQRQAFLDTD